MATQRPLPPRTQAMLQAPVLPTLLKLAAPNVLVVVVQALAGTVDAFYVSHLGPEVLAGVALVFPVWVLNVTMAAAALGGGVTSATARWLGAGNRPEASATATHGAVLSLMFALAFSVLLLLGGGALYQALGATGPVLEAAVAYSNMLFAGVATVWLFNAFAGSLRGSGDMLRPAVVVVGGELFHVLLAPALVFGFGPVPALGVTGAALSLVASFALRAAVLGSMLLMAHPDSVVVLRRVPLSRSHFNNILSVTIPGAIQALVNAANTTLTTGLMAPLGTTALAGYGLCARLEFLQIPMVFGLGTALVAMVGANVGAGNLQRARRIAWTGAAVAGAVTGTIGLVTGLAPAVWLSLFNAPAEVFAAGEAYLRIAAPSYLFLGVGVSLFFAAQGARMATIPLASATVRCLLAVGGGMLAVNLLGLGIAGLAVAVAASYLISAVLPAVALHRKLR